MLRARDLAQVFLHHIEKVVITITYIFQVEYAKSLRKLEEISESIHAQRKLKQKLNQFREPGVGAEEYLKSLPSYDLDDCYERSTVSGQSSSRIGMNFYLVKSDFTYIFNFLTFYTFLADFLKYLLILFKDSEFDEDEIDYNNDKVDQDDKVVSRTMSCPDQMMKSLSLKESQS